MNDSLTFRLVIATVIVGALLAVFDPANRSTTVVARPSVQQPATAQPPTTLPASPATYHIAASN